MKTTQGCSSPRAGVFIGLGLGLVTLCLKPLVPQSGGPAEGGY